MTRGFGVAAALAVMGALPCMAAEDNPLVKSVSLAEQELYDSAPERPDPAPPPDAGRRPDAGQGARSIEHRFPITLADSVDVQSLVAPISQVLIGQRPDPQLAQAFNASVKVLPDAGPTLVVAVTRPELVAQPATYQIELMLKGRKQNTDVTQSVAVKLVHPAAKLRPIPTLILSRKRLPVVDFAWGDYPKDLALAEISKRSGLTKLELRQLGQVLHEGEPVLAHVKQQTIASIAAGAATAAPITLVGEFPVGTTRGHIEVSAPQLEAPVQIDYEVLTRVPSPLIPVFFLVGVGLGQLIRGRLQKKEETDRRKLRALNVRTKLERLAARSEPDDAGVLKQRIQDLDEAKDDDVELDQKIAQANEALAAALASRDAKLRALRADLTREIALLHQRWQLPPTMLVAPVAAALQKTQERAADNDLLGSVEAQRDVQQAVHALALAAREWAISNLDRLQKLKLRPHPVASELSLAIETARSAQVPLKANDGPSPALEAVLRSAHASSSALRDFDQQLGEAIGALAEKTALAAPPADADAIRSASKPVLEEADRSDAGRILDRLTEALDALTEAVRKVVDAILPAGSPDRKGVDEHLAAHRYAQALQSARELKLTKPQDISDDESLTPPPPKPAKASGERLALARGLEPAPGASANLFILAGGREAEQADRAAMERQIRNTHWIRTWAVGAVLAVFTWAFYDHEFFGTGRELFSLFALGFTSDLTADALSGALDRVKKG